MGKDKILYTESSMTNLLSFGFLKEFESAFDGQHLTPLTEIDLIYSSLEFVG